MKIKKITLTNHSILGDIEIDFTDEKDKPVDTIVLAGENGTGKTTILDIIYEFSLYHTNNKLSDEKREFELLLSEEDINIIKGNNSTGRYFSTISSPFVKIVFDYSKSGWNQINIFVELNGEIQEQRGNRLAQEGVNKIFRSIYSNVEINFTPNQIRNVTAKKLDEDVQASVKSNNNIATEIAQLLIDIKALDDSEFADWGEKNIGKQVEERKLNKRVKRFKSAFNYMFPDLELETVKNVEGQKKIVFSQFGSEVFLDDLSSGEKQIVFRGSFLLKDKQSSKGVFALIDEPEISLHPDWQIKILDFYKKLFTDEDGNQSSQIFLATHSPFIIHNYKRKKDKVLVLKKNTEGKIHIDNNPSFYGWSKGKLVQEAYRIDNFLESVSSKPVVITEGKTDAKILRIAWSKLHPGEDVPFVFEPSGIEISEEKRSGNAHQTRRTLELISNISNDITIIGLFDNDREGNEQFKSLNPKIFEEWNIALKSRKHISKKIFGVLLPVPQNRNLFVGSSDITQRYFAIEHYFSDEILERKNLKGDSILNTEVFKIKGGRKNQFAESLDEFAPEEFSSFEILFDKLLNLIAD